MTQFYPFVKQSAASNSSLCHLFHPGRCSGFAQRGTKPPKQEKETKKEKPGRPKASWRAWELTLRL